MTPTQSNPNPKPHGQAAREYPGAVQKATSPRTRCETVVAAVEQLPPTCELEQRGPPPPEHSGFVGQVVVAVLAVVGSIILFDWFRLNSIEGDYEGSNALVGGYGIIAGLLLLAFTGVALLRDRPPGIAVACAFGFVLSEAIWVVFGAGLLGSPDLGRPALASHTAIFIVVTLALSIFMVPAVIGPPQKHESVMMKLAGFTTSADHAAWWDGSSWHDASLEMPPRATRLWWDGSSWLDNAEEQASHGAPQVWWDGKIWRNRPTVVIKPDDESGD